MQKYCDFKKKSLLLHHLFYQLQPFIYKQVLANRFPSNKIINSFYMSLRTHVEFLYFPNTPCTI